MDVSDQATSVSFTNPLVSVKQVICMVGLPARGKTYISRKLAGYLTWIGIKVEVFNVGEYRRKATKEYNHHDFFKSTNTEAMSLRQGVAEDALQDALDFLNHGKGEVAIFDATNTTVERRKMVHDRVSQHKFKCLFIESICNKEELIKANIAEVKVHGPDYEQEPNKEKAVEDFKLRIAHYKETYVEMDDELESHLSYMKLINAGERLVITRHSGNLQSKIGYWLMNMHIRKRTIYLTRHGESQFNVEGKIGGDSSLSERGKEYAQALASKVEELNIPNLRIWTSWMNRTVETAAHIKGTQERWKALNEIHAGACEEMTYEEIKNKFPEEYAARELNKLSFRYRGGESYQDLIARLESLIMELESQGDVLIVAHQAVLRCILSYFMGKSLEELPYVQIPLHTLMKLSPNANGCEEKLIPLGIDAVDTHRPRSSMSLTANGEEKDFGNLLTVATNQQFTTAGLGSPRIQVEGAEVQRKEETVEDQ